MLRFFKSRLALNSAKRFAAPGGPLISRSESPQSLTNRRGILKSALAGTAAQLGLGALPANGEENPVVPNGLFQEERRRKCVVIEPAPKLTQNLGAGTAVTLAHLQGAGTVDLIQLGLGPINPPGPVDKGNRVMLDSLLRIYIDGGPPLVTDLGTFFVAHGESDPWACDRLGVTGLDHLNWSGCSYFRRVMIPYSSSCLIELVNGSTISSSALFSQIYYYEGATPTSLTGTRRNRFAWQWTPFTRVAPFSTLDLLNITGKGTMDGIQLFTAGPITPGYAGDPNRFPPCWLEGNPVFTIDGGLGDWHSGGTEDFFGTQGYGFGLHQTTDNWGMPTLKPIGGNQFCVTMYRFFDRDPVIFNDSCKFAICNGQPFQGDGTPPPEITVAALVSYYLA